MTPIKKPVEEVAAAAATDCDQYITPDCVKALYQIPPGNLSTPGNELGIFETGDTYDQTDLDLFFLLMYNEIPIGTHPTPNLVDGAQAPTELLLGGEESALDFQISYPVIWPQGSVLFQTDDINYSEGSEYTGFLNNFLDAIDGSYCSVTEPEDPPYPDPSPGGYNQPKQCGVYKATNVVSVSYGESESDLPVSYQKRQCNEYLKLSLSVCFP